MDDDSLITLAGVLAARWPRSLESDIMHASAHKSMNRPPREKRPRGAFFLSANALDRDGSTELYCEMNASLLVASLLSAFAAGLHGLLGESAILRGATKTALPRFRLPSTFAFLGMPSHAPDAPLQWRYLRATWHFLTIDFVFAAIVFAVAASSPSPALALLVRLTAVRYATYAVAWFIIVALKHRSVWRAPHWALLLAIAGCAWQV